jgi:GlpG protein
MNFDALFHRDSLWPKLTPIACSICVLVFIGLAMLGDNPTYEQESRWGYYPDIDIWQGKPWALITSVFVHLQILHFAFNVYWLWILGNCLEEEVGPGRWLAFFLGAAWVSSSLQLLTSGDQGIGMSGVGYALFGFGWVARHRMPAFKAILSDQNIMFFMLWLVGCMVATALNIMSVGNAAHVAGLAFGAAVAGVFVLRWRLPLAVTGLVLLLGVSIVPLFWSPLSPDWRALQGIEQFDLSELDE